MDKSPYKIYSSKEALENARLQTTANTTYTERFYTLMKLIKISKMINNATIISSPKMKE